MKKRILYLLVTGIIISIFLFPQLLLSAPYYEGKTVRIIVGFGPGGGYDRMARLLAKHLPKHIPGKPVVLVENIHHSAATDDDDLGIVIIGDLNEFDTFILEFPVELRRDLRL